MAKAIQRRRGTAAQHAAFTGLVGEFTYDSDDKRIVAHDGSTAGGIPCARESELQGLGAFVDPNADKLMFWDDSAGKITSLDVPGSLIITATAAYIRESIIIACSDESTALTAGTNKVKFRMPYAFTLIDVKASLSTPQSSGNIFTVDVNEVNASPDAPVSVLSTKITIKNQAKTSKTADAQPVISDTGLADDAEITIDIDQIGDGTAKGLKVVLIGYQP